MSYSFFNNLNISLLRMAKIWVKFWKKGTKTTVINQMFSQTLNLNNSWEKMKY